MAAAQAVGITHRAEIAAASDPVAHQLELSDRYAAQHPSAHAAAREGFIDDVIAPSVMRERLCAALTTFVGKRS